MTRGKVVRRLYVYVLGARVIPSKEDTMRSLRVMVLLLFCCIIGKSIILLFIADRVLITAATSDVVRRVDRYYTWRFARRRRAIASSSIITRLIELVI